MVIVLPARGLKDVYDSTRNLQKFYLYVNSLLNGKGGTVVIHSKNPNLLERFDQKVDKKLIDLISDGSMYHDLFERGYSDDAHLVYRIKPCAKNKPWSTLDFKTKTSTNKGRDVPSYVQLSVWLENLCAQPNRSFKSANEGDMEFENGKQVFIKKDYGREPFQESMTIQAKSLRHATTQDLVRHCWKTLKLNEYISAFTKIRGGGSVYFGVGEHKEEKELWISALPRCTKFVKLTTHARAEKWNIWKDPNLRTKPTLFYVAKGNKVKTVEKATGEFWTEAIHLTKEERVRFHRGILERVVDELKWVGVEEPYDPVQVFFHDVASAPTDHCVIEVKVNYYHGLCFHDKEGPESYRIKGPGNPRTAPAPHRIDFPEWVESFNTKAARQMKELSWKTGVSILVL